MHCVILRTVIVTLCQHFTSIVYGWGGGYLHGFTARNHRDFSKSCFKSEMKKTSRTHASDKWTTYGYRRKAETTAAASTPKLPYCAIACLRQLLMSLMD